MYVRMAYFQGGDAEKMRQSVEERRAAGATMPDGVRRAMSLEGEGQRVFVTFFDSREAIDAAEAEFEKMGDTIPEEIRGKRMGLSVFEVAFDEEM
jgi:hypothetical protein